MGERGRAGRLPGPGAESDEKLIGRLRDGDGGAYEQLWRRHITAALGFARRLTTDQAEDLVSEAFLAVHHQVVAGNGPRDAFRAYLFATIRNTFYSWRRENQRVVLDPDVDRVDSSHDGIVVLERDAAASELLTAFKSLPERWQRVLWLTEVEETPRPMIAEEFGIRPNAVSALYRRARRGLRLNWLELQVPPQIREDRAHAARLLPALIVAGDPPGSAIAEHLARCGDCEELYAELSAAYGAIGSRALAVTGFAALGIALPAASSGTLTALGAGTAALLGGVGISTAVAASIGVIIAGGALTAAFLLGAPSQNEAAEKTGGTAQSETAGRPSAGRPGSSDRSDTSGRPSPPSGTQTPAPAADAGDGLGRGNTDSTVPILDLGEPSDGGWVGPQRPAPVAPGTVPDPGPTSGPEQDSELRAGLLPAAGGTSYVAPVIGGTTAPDASVVVELSYPPESTAVPQQFLADVEPSGAWSFDFRALIPDMPGTFEYRVWTFTESEASAAETGGFTLAPPPLAGFAGISELGLAESSSTGVVFEVAGPANGTVCLASVYSGQTTEIPLDANGSAVRRIRLLSGGFYYLTFRVCEGAYWGPASEAAFDVVDPEGPGFGFFGGDEEPLFELSEP